MTLKFAVLAALAGTASIASAEEPAAPPPPAADNAALITAIAGDPTARRPLARLRNPLCLTVAAEDAEFARIVASRIIDNAKEAGIPTSSRAKCRPNALVSFSADALSQIATFRAEGRKLFRMMSEKEIDAALAVRDPAYVFQAVQMSPGPEEGDALTSGANGESWTKERSALRAPEDLVTSLVVIEAGAIAGRSPLQVADYATLRLLAPTGEIAADSGRAPATILSLFAAPDQAPAQMTRVDRAYLRSLYKLPRTAFAKEVLAAAEVTATATPATAEPAR